MKLNLSLLTLSISAIIVSGCSKTEDEPQTPSGPVYTDVKTYEMTLLGSQTNPSTGSFYSTSEDSVYFTAKAGQKQSKIDLIYYFGSQSPLDSSTIASPKDVVFTNVDDQNPHKSIKTWTTKNDTKFMITNLSSDSFFQIKTDSLFQTDLDSGLTLTKVAKLEVGDVIAFKTQAGKLGMYHVRSIVNTTAVTRNITIDVKVQQ